ncbi:MAG: MATE family efflux transporter [Eubacteriaceae bacterium]|nr:MATE family efflux transporter [Eubacteriaceae bacterium]
MSQKGNRRAERSEMMLNGNIKRVILAMAIPTIAAQLVSVFYNLVDTYFVSTIGTSATAAVGVNHSLERTITMIGSFIGTGAGSLLARSLGQMDKEKADRVLSTAVFTGMGAGLLISLGGLAMGENLVRSLGANDDCVIYAMQYARYVLIAAPFMIGSLILNSCLKSEGSATIAMIGITFGSVLNCFLDPLFIRTFGLGVTGASIATAVSKTVSFSILLYMYVSKKSAAALALRKVRYVWAEIFDISKIGSTALFRTLCMLIGNIIINRTAGAYSTSALAAMSVTSRIMEFPFHIVLGFGMGYQPVAGYNWGARQYSRVREGLRYATVVSIIGGIGLAAFFILLRNPLITVFNRSADPEVARLCSLAITLQCLVLPAHTFVSANNMFYAGIGKALPALALSIARQGYTLYPMLFVLPRLFGVDGLAAAQAAADLLSLVVSIPLAIHAHALINAAEKAYEAETAR